MVCASGEKSFSTIALPCSFDAMGEANGVFTHYHPNGHMSIRGRASGGQIDGELEEWDKNGI